ncbi:MAG TPA: hypothetical protein VEU33_24655 [Archangium sp.]|nr:hypothetical protein [Archangium sp.]
MLRDLVWFNGGRAANEDVLGELGERVDDGTVVYVVALEDVLEERLHGMPPPPPEDAWPEDGLPRRLGVEWTPPPSPADVEEAEHG